MDSQSRASMSKLSEADAHEDERLRRPAGTTGGRTTYGSKNTRSTTDTTAPTNDQPPATSSPEAASAAAAAAEAMRNATTSFDGTRQVTEYERSLLEETANLYDPTAPLKVSNKDVIWTIEEFPLLNVTAINNSDSGGAQRVNQEFKTAPKTFHEYMPDFRKMNSMNWNIIIAELAISISRFFMSDLAGAFLLQASIVKPSRLTEVPAAVRALDDAIFQRIKVEGSCSAMAQHRVDQFIKSRAVMGGAQLTGIALLACMLEAMGVTKMTNREIQRKCTQEGRFY